jgi:2-C-methyl-D-erythritol 4-phosphate cytidylyltransferase
MAKFSVILPAAGQSNRFQGTHKKPFTDLCGRAVWLHAAEKFASRDDVCQLLLVVSAEDFATVQRSFFAEITRWDIKVIVGGTQRVDSVRNGLSAVAAAATHVAVHDAARPCVCPGKIDEVFRAALDTGAAILAAPVVSTLKRSHDADAQPTHARATSDSDWPTIESTLPRERIWQAQTPQVFRRDWLQQAFTQYAASLTQPNSSSLLIPTDEAQMLERIGLPVSLVTSPDSNLKITTQSDLELARLLLEQ